MSDKKNTNTQDTHKETADKAEVILNGTKKRFGVYKCASDLRGFEYSQFPA